MKGFEMSMVTEIPIGKIVPPSEDGIRKVGIEGLAENIKAVGLINALTVRAVGKNEYAIVAGRRRFWACQLAGIEHVKCDILEDAQRDQADVIEVTENLHRVQLTPMQEAEAIQKLRELKHTDESIAADLGMTRQFVARRAKLLDLSAKWKMGLTEPGIKLRPSVECKVHLWPVACLEIIARYPHEKQDDLLQKLGSDADITLDDLKREAGEDESKLSSAIWDLGDAFLLPKAGACANCPKRAGAQPLLFFDEVDNAIDLKKDRCLDKACWKAKHKATIERKVREKTKEHPNLVKISEGGARGHTLGSYQYEAAKKEDKGAVPALRVDGPKVGSITYVKVKKSQLSRSSVGSSKPVEKKKSPEQLAKEREARRWSIVFETICDALGGQNRYGGHGKGKVRPQLKVKGVLATGTEIERLRYLGAITAVGYGYDLTWPDVVRVLADVRTVNLDNLIALVWKSIREGVGDKFAPYNWLNTEKNEQLKTDLKLFLDLFDLKFDDLWAQALKEVPEPKVQIFSGNCHTCKKALAGLPSITSQGGQDYCSVNCFENPKAKKDAVQDDTPPHKPNEHGVFIDPQRINIPLPKTLKCVANILLAKGKDGNWYYAYDFKHSAGASSGLPHFKKQDSCNTREQAIGRATESLLGAIKNHHESTGTGEANKKRLDKAFALVKEWAKGRATTTERTCRKCGCTENQPCQTKYGPCSWDGPDICSVCARGEGVMGKPPNVK